MLHLKQRQALIDTAIAMNNSRINHGTSGNVSVRVKNGLLITPSGMKYTQLNPGDIVFMSMDGTPHTRRSKPSSEWRFHRDIYRAKEEAGAILHAHSPWCTTLACLRRKIPPFHYMVAVAGGTTIRLAPYATFGSQKLSDYALQALHERKACLLANHGMLCFEANLESALDLAIEIENLARVYCQALQIGTPQLLSDAELQTVLERFSKYKAENQPEKDTSQAKPLQAIY